MLKRIYQNEKIRTYLWYTFLFVIMTVILFLPFIRLGKSLVFAKDGLYQHYNAFVYWGTYIRTVLRNLIYSHKLVIPMWEFGIGYGADIITTLSYYVIGDPIALLAAVTPVKYADMMYSLLILLRFYLAGAAFCMYARKMHCNNFAVVGVGLGYAFCGVALHVAIMHPYFANPMIYLPLLLLGAEKIFRKERSLLFVFMVFISCISNYYFFYQLVLIVILYVVVRYLTAHQEKGQISGLFVLCAKFAGLALIGVAMAAVVFLPSAMAFLSSGRINAGYQYSALYSGKYYRGLAGAYISNQDPGSQTYIGVTPIFLLGAGALYIKTKRKEHSWLKWMIALMTLFLLLPFFGHVFNGLGYVCNRWSYAYVFFLAYALASMLPAIAAFNKRERLRLGILTMFYSVLCIVFWESRREDVLMNVAVLWMSCFMVLHIRDMKGWLRKFAGRYGNRIAQCLIMILVMLGIWSNGFYLYSDAGLWYATRGHDLNNCYQDITEITAIAGELTGMDDSFYRLDIHEGDIRDGGNGEGRNALISDHQSTTSMYWSVLSPHLISYLTGNSAYSGANYEYRNLQSRSLLMPFSSVKYYVHAGDGEYENFADVPYGYEYYGKKTGVNGSLYTVYKSDLALPLGYTYDAYITASEYEALSVEERQQAMLYGVVLEDSTCEETELEHGMPQFTQQNLTYDVTGDGNIELDGKKIIVKKENAKITLNFACEADRELYIRLSALKFEGKKPSDMITEEEWDSYSKWKKENIRIEEREWKRPGWTWLTADCDGRSAGLQCITKYDHVYDGRTEYLFNLGYSQEARNTITLSFDEPGIYTYEELKVIAQPMDMLDSRVEELTADVLEELIITDNRISGVITTDQTKLLCLSVPYSKGWKIYIDGQETELLQSNVMYMGAMISEGTHTVELRYETPYLRVGFVITVIGVLICIGFGLYERKVRSK